MHTDLFLALKDPNNPRGHPILSALAYVFCPSAAYWWLSGAEPVIPYDPVWHALEDMTTNDKSLKETLLGYGFSTFIENAQRYISQVDSYRRMHPGIDAPELLPTFTGDQSELSQRFGLANAIKQLGGDWRYFWPYVRTWGFLLDDWEMNLHITGAGESTLARQQLSLMIQDTRRPVHFPTWVWKVKIGKASRNVIGLVVPPDGEQDQLRFSLMKFTSPPGDTPWEAHPEIYAISLSGTVCPGVERLPGGSLPEIVHALSKLAGDHPCPPLAALQHPSRCMQCGYSTQCYTPSQDISPIALKFRRSV